MTGLRGFWMTITLMAHAVLGQVHHAASPFFSERDTVSSDSSAYTYYPDGSVRCRNDFAKRERIRTVCFDSLGRRTFDLRIRDGNLDGVGVEWYPSGKVRSLNNYDHGSGFSMEYYPNGSLGSMREYANGEWVGEYTEWWPNGMLQYRINRDSTQQVARSYHENGVLESEGLLLEGEAPIGPWQQWYDTGVLRATGSWRDARSLPARNSPSVKCGEWKYYSLGGVLDSTEQFGPCGTN